MTPDQSAVCRRCGAPVRGENAVINHSVSDPLQVAECARCGSIVRIGGHQW